MHDVQSDETHIHSLLTLSPNLHLLPSRWRLSTKASEEFPTAPALAIPLALKAAHPQLTPQHMHWFEINEVGT